MEKHENLMDGLLKEIERNKELLKEYEAIPQGKFGAAMIKISIAQAEKAISENDVIKMIRAYKDLKQHQ